MYASANNVSLIRVQPGDSHTTDCHSVHMDVEWKRVDVRRRPHGYKPPQRVKPCSGRVMMIQ